MEWPSPFLPPPPPLKKKEAKPGTEDGLNAIIIIVIIVLAFQYHIVALAEPSVRIDGITLSLKKQLSRAKLLALELVLLEAPC